MEKWLVYLLIILIIAFTIILLALFSLDVLYSPTGSGIGVNLAPELKAYLYG